MLAKILTMHNNNWYYSFFFLQEKDNNIYLIIKNFQFFCVLSLLSLFLCLWFSVYGFLFYWLLDISKSMKIQQIKKKRENKNKKKAD